MRLYDRLRRLQFRYGARAPRRLMTYLVGAMAMVFVADYLLGPGFGISISSLFAFDRAAIFSGQVWRVLTFTILPPDSSIFFMAFALYFYYLIGNTLEEEWGSFWFDIYYLCGVIGTIVSGLITGYATNFYLNMSLFFAFAVMYPNFQMLVFFFLPVKIKWLAIIDAVWFLLAFLLGSWADRAAILAALANFFLFFGPSFLQGVRQEIKVRKRRAEFNREYRKGQDHHNRPW